jgi:DNA-binding NarL/FixJ family response regulator
VTITVVLADDHAALRDGLGYLLNAQDDIMILGYAADGREAVALTSKLKPDVILMDITMPELNGIDATEQICYCCPSTHVVILSMHASSEHVARALLAGANGYLLKESAGAEVIDAVRSANEGRRYLSKKISDTLVNNYLIQLRSNMDDSPLSLLSSREREVLQLVVEGKSSVKIADLLSLSPKTVETYRSRLMRKLDIDNLPSLVKFAIQHGLIPLD